MPPEHLLVKYLNQNKNWLCCNYNQLPNNIIIKSFFLFLFWEGGGGDNISLLLYIYTTKWTYKRSFWEQKSYRTSPSSPNSPSLWSSLSPSLREPLRWSRFCFLCWPSELTSELHTCWSTYYIKALCIRKFLPNLQIFSKMISDLFWLLMIIIMSVRISWMIFLIFIVIKGTHMPLAVFLISVTS